jgi:phage/plasmid-like protein (TIGR03299 family)
MKSIFDYLPEIDADTAEEMAKQGGLDFDAVKVDLHYNFLRDEEEIHIEPEEMRKAQVLLEGSSEDKEKAEAMLKEHVVMKEYQHRGTVPDKVAVIRGDDSRYLGTVGRNRGILQYREVLAFTESLVDAGEASYVTAGVIGNGEQAYLVMKSNKSVKLSGTDEVECYFYVTTSHDSSKGLEVVCSPLRKTNGTVLSLPKENRIRFKHTKRVADRVKKAKLSLAKVNSYFDEMETSFRLLRSVSLTQAQFSLFLESLVPDPKDKTKQAENTRADIETIYKTGAAQQLPSTKGTMLGAYFAVVEYMDKISTTKASKVRPNEHDAKLHRLLEGSGAQAKAEAYAFALDMARQMQSVSFAGSGANNNFATEV